jgi:hypothetical protein
MDDKNEELQITVVAGGAAAQCTPVSVTLCRCGHSQTKLLRLLTLSRNGSDLIYAVVFYFIWQLSFTNSAAVR